MTDIVKARNDDLEVRAVEEELVLLDLRSQTYLSLNRTGAALWPLIVDGAAPAALAQTLCDRFGVEAAVAARDVDALIGQLADADLLEGTGA
ncbi:MAG TPA: PqqD family protein [Acidimicrobiales bacterium]|jgi:hypothetical protein